MASRNASAAPHRRTALDIPSLPGHGRQHIEVAGNTEPIQQIHGRHDGLRAEIGRPIEITPEQCE